MSKKWYEIDKDSKSGDEYGSKDDCDFNAKDLRRWTMDNFKSEGNSDGKDSESSWGSEKERKDPPNKTPVASEPPVASVNPSFSTTSTLSSPSNTRYYRCERKKRKFRQHCIQQDAIWEAILQERKKTNESHDEMLNRDDNHEQSTMTQHFLPRSKMKNQPFSTYKTEEKKKMKEDLLQESKKSPFQSDDELDISSSEIGWRKRDFGEEVEKHEEKFQKCLLVPEKQKPKKRPIYKSYENMTFEEQNSYCIFCDNDKDNCHDVTMEPFFRDSFIRYFHEEGRKRADLLTAKKVFFNSYGNYLEIKEYEITKRLVMPKCYDKPPRCVMQGSFGFCVDWFNYQVNDGFIDKKINKKNYYSYDAKDFKRFK